MQFGSLNGEDERVLALYEPPDEHALLYERAECNAVRSLLHIHGLRDKYVVRKRLNVRSMSSKGLVPFLAVGNTESYAGIREINGYLKSRSAVAELTSSKSEAKASRTSLSSSAVGDAARSEVSQSEHVVESSLCSLLCDTLFNCEHYIVWQVDRTEVERRTSQLYAAPLDFLVARRERNEALAYEKPLCLTTRSVVECLQEANDALASLSWHLHARSKEGREAEFFAERPALLDALVYGHFAAFLDHDKKDEAVGQAQLRKVFERSEFDNLRRLYQTVAKRFVQ